MPLGAGAYLQGCVAALLVAGAVGWGACRVRARLVPDWRGPLARTAEATIGVATLVVVGQLLAAARVLRPLPALVALVGAGGAMAALGTRASGAPVAVGAPSDRSGRLGLTVVTLATAGVAAQWSAHTAVALRSGMTQFDTLFYHGPYSARFLQEGTIGRLEGIGTGGSRFYTLSSELLHALAAMPFGTDLASPLLNGGFFLVACVAARAIGQPKGLGHVAMLGALVVLSFPAFVSTQPGQASTDVASAAFLVAAVAMLLAGELRTAPTALAGVAAGLALGAKLTVAPTLATLTVGVLVVSLRRRGAAGARAERHRPWAAVALVGGMVAVAGAWFARNLLLADNPLPWFHLEVGPVALRRAAEPEADALLDTVTDLDIWRTDYLPELAQSMGRAWPVVLLAVAGASVSLTIGRSGLVRTAGLAVLVAFPAHVVMPLTGGIPFGNNLRYLHPALLLGGALVALAVARGGPRLRAATALGLGALVLVNLTSPHEARVAPWPREQLAIAMCVGVAVVAGAGASARRRGRPVGGPARGARLAAGGAALLAVAAGWPVQEGFHEHRYRTTDLPRVELYRPFQDVRGARVAVLGTPEVYPMFGPDLSNEVVSLTDVDRRPDLPACLGWREALVDRFDYVAISPFYRVHADLALDELAHDPAATVLVQNDLGIVYRIDGRLATDVCRAEQAG